MADTFDRFAGARSTYGVKKPCRAATTANITLSGFQVIDGVTYAAADETSNLNMRCLVKNQNNAYENGIYLVNSGAWTREKDFDGNTDFCSGTLVFVVSGTTNSGKIFYTSSSDQHVIGTSSINFSIFDIDKIISKGDDVLSASTLDLSATEQIMNITGSNAITTITIPEGYIRYVRFTGAATLTHSATLVLPGAQNITTASGDWAVFIGYPSSTTYCHAYQRADSHPHVTGRATIASAATTELGSVREQCIYVTGVETISSFGNTAPTGAVKFLAFASALSITYNATSMILPTAASISVASGDSATVIHDGGGNWRMLNFQRKYGRSVISVNTNTVSTTGTTSETNLMTYALPAGILSSNGYSIRLLAWGSVAATTTLKQIRTYFGGTAVADTASIALNGVSWTLDTQITRTSSAAQRAISSVMSSSHTTLPSVCQVATPAEDMSAAITVKVTGAAGTSLSTDISALGMTVELLPL